MVDALPALDAETWIAAVSHDLRDPMNAIVGMTDLLLDSPLDADQRRCAETVADAARTMTTLINDLLDLSRLQRGDLQIAAEAFDLGQAARRTLDLLRPCIGDRPVVVRLKAEADALPWVVGDPGRLRQILANLVGNALTHTQSGLVELGIVAPEGSEKVTFTVSDTGPGLEAAALARLGEPFAPSDTAAQRQGLGLGLAIARHLVVRMGGTLNLTSAPGQGTRVELSLPLPHVASPKVVPGRGLAGRCVALAGATPAVAGRPEARLRAAGVDVVVVDDPTPTLPSGRRVEALLLACDRIDEGASSRLRGWRRATSTGLPVLALVTSGLRGEAETARRAGFDGYLPLLAPGEVLADAIGSLLARPSDQRPPFVTVHGLLDLADGPWRLLVVDDNPMNVRLLQLLLERAGHSVETATDGSRAVLRARDGGLDAVLMDVQMPVLSGLAATAAIRRLPVPVSRVPIVAVTANALAGMGATCAAAGMDGFVTKPVEPIDLLAELRRVIAAARAAVR